MSEISKPTVSIKSICDHWEFKIITGDEDALKKLATVHDVNRPGLELAGFYAHSVPKRIVIIGDKEEAYINTLDEDIQIERFEYLTNPQTPCIILTKGRKCPKVLKEVAERKNFPVFCSESPSYRVMVDLVNYLDEKLAPTTSLHGVLLNVLGTGVLITGESGMGKSEITLELIQKGHILIADDRVDVSRVHRKLIGSAPELLKGMLEIRGIGVIDVEKMFGVSAVLNKTEIKLVISLEKFDPKADYDRVGIENDKYLKILDVDVPMVVLPVKEGRSMGVLVESTVRNYQLKKQGFDSAKEFEHRVLKYIEKQNKEGDK